MMYSREKHNETAEEIQGIYNQVLSTALTVTKSYPKKHKITRTANQFSSGFPYGPVYELKASLDNLVCGECKPGSGAEKIYDRNGQPGFHTPALLLGVPVKLAEQYNQIQVEKEKKLPSRLRPGLSLIEIISILLFLKHCVHRLSIIGADLTEHYGSDQETVAAVKKALAAFMNELAALLTELVEVVA